MTHSRTDADPLVPLGLKQLNKTWAKVEIFLGLTGVFLGLVVGFSRVQNFGPFGLDNAGVTLLRLVAGLLLFVLGGYLAMAGHRSHLYQSSNKLTAFLVEEIRKIKDRG